MQDVMVPEAHDDETLGFQNLGSSSVIGKLLGMLSAIQLNDQHGFPTGEIGDEPIYGNLSPKLEAAERASA